MSPNERFAAALDRIAFIPSIGRIRHEDGVRAERQVEDRDALIEAAAVKLRKLAAELEKAIA